MSNLKTVVAISIICIFTTLQIVSADAPNHGNFHFDYVHQTGGNWDYWYRGDNWVQSKKPTVCIKSIYGEDRTDVTGTTEHYEYFTLCGKGMEIAGFQWRPFSVIKDGQNWALWDETTAQGVKVGTFAEGEIPETNELILKSESIELYRLTTGEWQIVWNHGKIDYVIAGSIFQLNENPMH